MKKLNNQELNKIKGGGFISITTAVVATLISAFIFGIVDGVVNPQDCN